jgi:hypothetical protein
MFVCKYINDCNQIIDIDNFNNNWNIAQAIVNQQISLELINQFSLLDYQQIMIIAKIGFYLTNDTSWTSLFLPIIKNINKNLLFDQMQKIN